jgi:hypothetical protein
MKSLLDENLEHEVFHRLDNYGHDLVHVEISEEITKGAPDTELATISRQENRVIVTYDDNFRTDFVDGDYDAVLYFPDQTLSVRDVADVLHEISTYYAQDQLQGFMTVGRSWL